MVHKILNTFCIFNPVYLSHVTSLRRSTRRTRTLYPFLDSSLWSTFLPFSPSLTQ